MRNYFTLLSREARDMPWRIEFGDRDRETVEAEFEDYRDHGISRGNLKIVSTLTSRQAEIDAVVAKLNGRAT